MRVGQRRGTTMIVTLAVTIIAAFFPYRPVVAETLFPLTTEDAAPLAHGVAEPYFGFSYARNPRFPAFTPPGTLRSQHLFTLPHFGLRIGAGDWVEIQASFEFLYLDEKFRSGQSESTYGGGDARLFTKVRLFEETATWPALGLHFGTKLPNANRADRLGTDEADFIMSALASRDFGPLAAHANLGIAILGNSGPLVAGDTSFDTEGQDDLFLYNFALVGARQAPLFGCGDSWRPLAELRGTTASRYDNDRTDVRLGLQVANDPWEFYVGSVIGLSGIAEDFGVTTGAIYRFRPGSLF